MHEESVDGQAQCSVRTDGQAWQRLCAGRVVTAQKEQKASALSNLNFEGRDFGIGREQRRWSGNKVGIFEYARERVVVGLRSAQETKLVKSRKEVRAQNTRQPKTRSAAMICARSDATIMWYSVGKHERQSRWSLVLSAGSSAQTNRAVAKRLVSLGGIETAAHDSTA